MADKDILEAAKEDFARCEDAEEDNRRLWLDDMKFARLGEQCPEETKKKLES